MGVAPSPILFGPGGIASNLQTGLQFNNGTGPSLLTGTVNPSSVATAGVEGSLYLNQSSGITYQKQDNGSSTNWKAFFTSLASYAPTVQAFTSGSGTYTTPANCSYILVRMVGGGGGGGESGTANGSTIATSGGNTTFGTSLLVANGGSNAPHLSGSNVGGAGGGTSLGGAIGIALTGGNGNAGSTTTAANNFLPGGQGGNSFLNGGGPASWGATGIAGTANTGGGGAGGGGGSSSGFLTGSGGGAGGYLEAIITNPASSYPYVVGSGGTGGTAGTSGYAGGAGGSGYIEVTEFYSSPGAGTSVITRLIQSVSTSTNAGATASTDYVYLVSGTTTITLPTAVGNTNMYTIKNIDASLTTTIATTSSQTIDGSLTATLPVSNTSLSLISDGSNWRVV
jgi:hypothetical protein